MVVTDRLYAAASGWITPAIWVANSRVGASTRPRGWPGRVEREGPRLLPWSRDPARRATSGKEKANVLPEPVLPRPSTSRPARVSGSVSCWIGKAAVLPSRLSVSVGFFGTPRSAKGTFEVGFPGAGGGWGSVWGGAR